MGGGLGGVRGLPLRCHPAPVRGVLHRHSPADGERLAARGPRVQLHPHRHHRPPPSHVRQSRFLSHGLGRQRAPHRATGAELLRRALRPVAPPRPRFRCAARRGPTLGRSQAPDHRGQPAQLHRAVRAAHRGRREGLRGPVPAYRAVGGLDPHLRHHRRPLPAGVPARLPREPRTGRGLPDRGAVAVGRELPDRGGPSGTRRPGSARRLPQAALPGHRRQRHLDRHHPARAGAVVRGAGGPSRRRPLPAAIRLHGAHAGVRRGGTGAGARARGSRQGHRHSHDLHLRRHRRRHLVAGAEPAGAHRDRPRRALRGRGAPGHRVDRRARPPTPAWPARPQRRPAPRSRPFSPPPAT